MIRVAAILSMALTWLPALADGLTLQFGNLHTPYFPDRAPGAPPTEFGNFVPAPRPTKLLGIEGDTLPVVFTLVSTEAQKISIQVQIGLKGNPRPISTSPKIALYRGRDVRIEGNSNGTCACPAGQLPRSDGSSRMSCVDAPLVLESETPRYCPTAIQRTHIGATLVRRAPFAIVDALEPLPSGQANLAAGVTELFLADIPIDASLPKGMLDIQVTATTESGRTVSVVAPVRIMKLRLDNFPELELSYWLSEDPRDLIARPESAPLGASWGGEWWSEEHWRNLERAARLQASLGVTNVLVPLFVRNPFGVRARSLINVRCVTGSNVVPSEFGVTANQDGISPFNKSLTDWEYDFDFTYFHRFVSLFQRAGFRRFEGAHLLSSRSQLPLHLECDLYRTKSDARPYASNFRFMPRAGKENEPLEQRNLRGAIYRKNFLPAFTRRLASELHKAGIERNWYQHLIDENTSSDEAIASYGRLAATIRDQLPGIRTMDAVNQYTGPRYAGIMDVPVFHLALLYDDQMSRRNIRQETGRAFPGPKYFYNTALREGGPNRFLDTLPVEDRAYGWLAVELEYQGILYWAANQYRYPVGSDISRFRRSDDWSPYRYSHGPLPNGFVAPAYSPGANWNLYPSENGLIGSLRARRLRDGLLDHWVFGKASSMCRKAGPVDCDKTLAAIRKRLTGNSYVIADISRNPADYDDARLLMLEMIEP